jgi:hypothetical protein
MEVSGQLQVVGVIVLDVHASTKDKSDDTGDSFHEEL